MADEEDSLRSTQARIAAFTRAARTDGAQISAPARRAFLESFLLGHECTHCKWVPVDQSLSSEQRHRAAAALMSAHFSRLALASARARGRARNLISSADKADRELATGLAQLDAHSN